MTDNQADQDSSQTSQVEALFLTLRAATEFVGCTKEELLAWVEPDRRLPGDFGPETGARLWLRTTLNAVKPNIKAWRKRDREASAARMAESAVVQEAAKARRKGLRKGGALTVKVVCERLECTLTELNRWASDGRLPPDGETVMAGLPKTVTARVWLPETVEGAKLHLEEWRQQDQAKKHFKRRGLRSVV